MENIRLSVPLVMNPGELANTIVCSGVTREQVFELIRCLEAEMEDFDFLERVHEHFKREYENALKEF